MLVIGGGITGAAAAWDAAQRGLRVALVEAGDFGGGTSWNSLRTIHGGLRHLQRADVPAVRASARERAAFLANAPALVRPLPFLVPTYGHGLRGREAMAAALFANDVLTADRNRGLPASHRIPRGRILSTAEVRALVPGLPASGLTGGALWTDAQASSERLVLALLRAAAREGAALANHAAVETLARDQVGRVVGARCRDRIGGGAVHVRARVTINAAGPGADAVLAAAGVPPIRVPLLRAWNLVLRRPVVPALAVGAWSEGRYLFLVPWRDRTIVGTGYAPADGPVDGARALLDAARVAFPWAGLDAAEVTLVHEGRVPGNTAATLWTRHLVRDHARDGAPGLLSAIGVKFTGGRALAESAVDLALARLGRPHVPSRTSTTPLPDATALPGPLEAAARAAVADEMAVHLEDAVARRLDLGAGGPPDPVDVERVLDAMAPLRGWDAAARDRERAALAAFYAARRL